MGQKLVRGRVLPPAEQFAGCDLVEDGGQFVRPGFSADKVVFEFLCRVLKVPEVVTYQCDLVSADLGNGVRDLHRRVLAFKGPTRLRSEPTEIGGSWSLERKRRLVIRGATGVAGVEFLNPGPAVVPQ